MDTTFTYIGSQYLLLTISVGQKMLKNKVQIIGSAWPVKIHIMGHLKCILM